MTSIEFNLLDFNKKEKLVNRFGQLIEKKYSQSNLRISTYTLSDFYVEVAEKYNHQIQFIKAIEEKMLDCDENFIFKVFLN